MCCQKAKWKREREEVQDHKFDFVDVREFEQDNCMLRFKYSFVFLLVLKSILVYLADLWTAGMLLFLSEERWAVKPKIPFRISRWIFFGCIVASFILLALDMKKARKIIRSKDISYTFTNVIASRYYTLRSYPHYCFFAEINRSRKKWNSIAFFVFFRLKGWKRLLFAEAPRQAINAFTLYSILHSKRFTHDIDRYGDNLFQKMAIFVMAFTLLIFIGSALLIMVAFFLYLPLLCHIRGNLKEYLCHKVDMRIGRLLKRNQKNRLKNHLRAKVDASFSKRFANDVMHTLREPTLPQVQLAEEDDIASTSTYSSGSPDAKTLSFSQVTPPLGTHDSTLVPPSSGRTETGRRLSSETTSTAYSSTPTMTIPYDNNMDTVTVYGDPNPAVTRRHNEPYPYAPAPPSLQRQPQGYRPGPGQDLGPGSGPGFNHSPGLPPRRSPPPRQSSPPSPSRMRPPTESTDFRGGGRGAMMPSRYGQDHRIPRYNNYAQQGGRYSRGRGRG